MFPSRSAQDQATSRTIRAAREAQDGGRTDEAFRLFRQVYDAGPGLHYASSLEGLAQLYTTRGDLSRALEMYRELVYVKEGQTWRSSQSNDISVLIPFALLLQRTGVYDEAWQVFSRAVEQFSAAGKGLPPLPTLIRSDVSTTRFTAVANLALTARWKDFDDSRAVAHARDAVALWPTGGTPHFYLGHFLIAKTNTRAEGLSEMATAAQFGRGEVREQAAKILDAYKREREAPATKAPATAAPQP